MTRLFLHTWDLTNSRQAPMTPPGTPVVNSLNKQRAAVTNIFRACVGLQPESDMTLEHKLF